MKNGSTSGHFTNWFCAHTLMSWAIPCRVRLRFGVRACQRRRHTVPHSKKVFPNTPNKWGCWLIRANPMQTLYAIHVNNVNQVSVDVFSEKHTGFSKWRSYFAVKPLTVARLRAIYAAHPKAFYIRKEWSPARWAAYKEWCLGEWARTARGGVGVSLDPLPTSGH